MNGASFPSSLSKDASSNGLAYFQAACVFVATFFIYVPLYSQLQIDDTARFLGAVAAGRYQWDASHLLMQPVTLLWHKAFGFGGNALLSQRTINTFSAAVTYAVFFLLLHRLGIDLFLRIFLVIIAAVSTYMLMLGTSGHMKLTTAPWLALALYACVIWERAMIDRSRHLSDYRGHVICAAIFLAVATGFLINSVVVLPFLAISMLVVLIRRGEPPYEIVKTAVLFSAVFALVVMPIFGFGYVQALKEHNYSGFFDFLVQKRAFHNPLASWPIVTGQTVHSMAKNFVWVNDLGPVIRAWLKGYIALDASYVRVLLAEAAYAGITVLLLLVTYVYTGIRLLKFENPVLTPAAFLIGSVCFAVWWNFHEAEFFFQITLPTLLMMAYIRPATVMRWVTAGWAVFLVTVNVFDRAVPWAAYPLTRYEREINAEFGARDLFIGFKQWSGKPDIQQFDLSRIPHWWLDVEMKDTGSAPDLLRRTRQEIEAAFARGGRVIVFRMFDDHDWDAPWSELPEMGLGKRRLRAFFAARYRIMPKGSLAELRAWELRPKS